MTVVPVSMTVAGTDLGDVVVLDVDATIVVAHGEKELARDVQQELRLPSPVGLVRQHHRTLGPDAVDREGRVTTTARHQVRVDGLLLRRT